MNQTFLKLLKLLWSILTRLDPKLCVEPDSGKLCNDGEVCVKYRYEGSGVHECRTLNPVNIVSNSKLPFN